MKLFTGHTSKNDFLNEVKFSVNGKYLFSLDDPYWYVFETAGLQLLKRFPAIGKNLLNFSVSHKRYNPFSKIKMLGEVIQSGKRASGT